MPTEDVLAVDIGNTRVHMGVVSPSAGRCYAMKSFVHGDVDCRYHEAVQNLHTIRPFKRAVVAGVVERVVDSMLSELVGAGIETKRFACDMVRGVEVSGYELSALGADRCANALYAAAQHPHKDVVIVSAGSAVVVDMVKKKVFSGGAIFPGLAMQCRALGEFTDALPAVECGAGSIGVPGTTTRECIEGGVLFGAAGGIDAIVNTYLEHCTSGETILCATGGDWPLLAPYCKKTFLSIPEMTLVGTALILL